MNLKNGEEAYLGKRDFLIGAIIEVEIINHVSRPIHLELEGSKHRLADL
jgi:hypothetical protein